VYQAGRFGQVLLNKGGYDPLDATTLPAGPIRELGEMVVGWSSLNPLARIPGGHKVPLGPTHETRVEALRQNVPAILRHQLRRYHQRLSDADRSLPIFQTGEPNRRITNPPGGAA
jgi:hypothetical protein